MKSLKKYEAPITAIALVVSIITALLHAMSVIFFSDAVGYFITGAALPVVSSILFALSVAAFAVCAIFFTNNEKEIPAPKGMGKYAALLPAAALAFQAVDILIGIIGGSASGIYELLMFALAIISAVFFFTVTFSKKYGTTTALCGVGFIVWLALSWFSSYSDLLIPMNSPDKLFFHFGCIGAALLTVAELRSMYGISRPAFYRFSLWTALICLSAASLPVMAEFIFKNSRSSVFFESFVQFGLYVYAFVRAISLIFQNPQSTEE